MLIDERLEPNTIIIAVLAVIAIYYLIKTQRLKAQLVEEKNKRILPVLVPEIDPVEIMLYLKNDSDCDAKSIKIQDISLTLDYEFKKALAVKFEPIELIPAHRRVAVQYRVFDGKYEMTGDARRNLVSHLLSATFDLRLTYANIENIPFESTIGKDRDKFFIKSAHPLL